MGVRRGDGPKLMECGVLREHGLTASSYSKRSPRIMVKEVDEDIDSGALVERMCAMNTIVSGREGIRVVRQVKRSNGRSTYILEVPSVVRRRLVGEGRVSLGWRSYPVSDFLNVRQCYRCLAVGHLAAACNLKSKWPICCRCTKTHAKEKCNAKEVVCVNCINRGFKNIGHSALDTMKCPILRKAYSAEAQQLDI